MSHSRATKDWGTGARLLARRVWLPLFLLTSVSWLWAPAYYHNHYGNLKLISSYEGGVLPGSGLFRVSDVVAALLLIAAVWLFGLFRRDRIMACGVLVAGVLSAIDGIFADKCDVMRLDCHGLSLISSGVHDIESVLLALLIVALGVYHARKYRLNISWWFVSSQIIMGLLVVSGLLSSQMIAVIQYAYELLIISWLAWLITTFADTSQIETSGRRWIRTTFGWWTFINGAFAIVVSVTHHSYLHVLFSASLAHESALVGQHGVIAGVLMLYVARQVYQGQRRAALVLLAIFGSEVIKYSVVSPSPILLAVNMLSFVLLLYGRRAFDRNTSPLPFSDRAQNALVVVGGVLGAVVLSNILTSLAGHSGIVQHDIHTTYQRPARIAEQEEDRLNIHDSQRLRVVGNTLIVSTIGLAAWSLFRPLKLSVAQNVYDRRRARQLLERFSRSSEDYFKLWPNDKNYYFAADGQGFVAYTVNGTNAFALADPICAPVKRSALLADFTGFCRSRGWSVCFVPVPDLSRQLYSRTLKLFKIGSSAIIDVAHFNEQTRGDKWWRWQRNRADRKYLNYQLSSPPHSHDLLVELRVVSDAWLAQSGHSEYGFALGYFDESYLQKCRLHLVREASGQLLAFANELPVFGSQTQRTVDLIRYKPGENGVMPYLLMELLATLGKEGICQTFDLGFVPLAGIESAVVHAARRLASGRFSSLGLEQFKNKFDPVWRPDYIAYDGDVIDLARIAVGLEAVVKSPDAK